jgi:hypothetical protein
VAALTEGCGLPSFFSPAVLPNGDKGCRSRGSGEVVRGRLLGSGPPPARPFEVLPFIRKDEVRKLAGVLAGLVVLQKSAGDVW